MKISSHNITFTRASIAIVAVAITGITGVYLSKNNTVPAVVQEVKTLPSVSLIDINPFANTSAANVATPDSAVVRSEGGGRVTRVLPIGTTVVAGDVVAELENSAQSAALTSARGAYEAALAGRDLANLGQAPAATGLAVAESGARTAISAAHSFIDDAIRAKTDAGFANKNNDNLRRFLVDNFAIEYKEFVSINEQRAAFNSVLRSENNPSTRMSDTASLAALLKEESVNLVKLQKYLGDLADVWGRAHRSGVELTPELIESQRAIISALRLSLPQIQGSVASAEASLSQATLGRETSAKQTGASGTLAAQIKIAQGQLDAAKSAYDKTVIRTQNSGRIAGANIRVGDIITPGTDAVLVAPVTLLTGTTYTLPLTAVKYDATGNYVFTVAADNTLSAHEVKTGLLTASNITVAFVGTNTSASIDRIVRDVRGLKAGTAVTVSSK